MMTPAAPQLACSRSLQLNDKQEYKCTSSQQQRQRRGVAHAPLRSTHTPAPPPPPEPMKRTAAAQLRPVLDTAHASLRSLEGPARARYAQWRELVAGALAASPLDIEPQRAAALADAGSLMVGTGTLGLLSGMLLSLAVGY